MQEVANRITAEFVKNFEQALSASPDAGHAGASESRASSQSPTPEILSGRSCATASLHCFESVPAEVSARRHQCSNATESRRRS